MRAVVGKHDIKSMFDRAEVHVESEIYIADCVDDVSQKARDIGATAIGFRKGRKAKDRFQARVT